MAVAQGSAYFQLLADGESLFCTDNLQFADASARTAFHSLHVEDAAEVHLQFLFEQVLQFLLSQRHLPAVEIGSLLVVVV